MNKIFPALIVFVMLSTIALAGCAPTAQKETSGLHVLATTTFLADITRNVTGNRVTVESLLPTGADPHGYQLTPADVVKINVSNVLIQNGIGYEKFLETVLQNAGGERLVITASDGLTPKTMDENGGQVGDPHMWLDPNRVVKYVENIRDGLIKADPGGEAIYKSNAEAYIAQIRELDAWIVGQVNTIPAGHRLLVTNHEALGYFAEHYGFTIVGTVILSFSSEAGTSAQELAALIDQIKSTGAPAIFLDGVENRNIADQIAAETGVKVVANLHLESLTDGTPAATYIEMMKYNVSAIVEALR
jgi:ABC-type Zn uptake system ZnuABC Zn-binding protein ZnuA